MGDLGSIPVLVRTPVEGNGYLLQYSGLENYMDRGAWQATYNPWDGKESDMTEQLSLSLDAILVLKGKKKKSIIKEHVKKNT